RGRQAFALRKGPLERRQSLVREARLVRRRRTLGTNARVEDAARAVEVGANAIEQRLCRLASKPDALPRAAQPVERRRRRLAAARGVGELLLRLCPLLQQRLDLLVHAPARELRGRPAALAPR